MNHSILKYIFIQIVRYYMLVAVNKLNKFMTHKNRTKIIPTSIEI